jgi:lipopolysaccharide export system permease protein
VLLKKLHKLSLKSFLPPFIATLFICVFLLFLVQVVITYLDDFIGKGLNTLDLLTLFAYAWIAIVPQGIPLAVLLASIMSFGNMAENYELAAMKSSGLSLYKIMQPVFGFILFLAFVTFLFNNFILPVVHLKSSSLLYDIRQKKPTVSLKEGIFYNGIENYSIRVGKKSANKDTLTDIYIYDHSAHLGNNIQMYAHKGKITTTSDTSELVLILRDGNRYEEVRKLGSPQSPGALSQLSYKQLQVNIPLEDFKLKRTNEELFKGHGEMLNVWQLDSVVDSTKRIVRRRIDNLYTQSKINFYAQTSLRVKNDSLVLNTKVQTFLDSLPKAQFLQVVDNALNLGRSAVGNIDNFEVGYQNDTDQVVNLLIEWHKKIVVCFACIILFFVGAPLGAIIKKGGLGMPVIISVLFFLAYYILTEMFMQLALDRKLPVWQAMWMPLVIFLPISIFLTIKAAKDSVIFDLSAYYMLIEKLFKKRTKTS